MLHIIDAIRIYEKSLGNKENIFTGDLLSEKERTYIVSNCNAFLIGLISDQSVKAETAWSLPYKLSKRLDISDPNEIAETYSMEEVKAVIKQKPALHRYPGNIAGYIWLASKKLCQEYDGQASNIWKEATAAEIVKRLEAFKGISHKKAALACLLLVRDFGLDVPDKENIDIIYELHIRKIFLRAGFCEHDSYEAITQAARKINPEFPGYLTSAFWAIGREICHPNDPECGICPINNFCKYYERKKPDEQSN